MEYGFLVYAAFFVFSGAICDFKNFDVRFERPMWTLISMRKTFPRTKSAAPTLRKQ